NRNTIEYLGIWEQLYNPNFNPLEFEGFIRASGANAFTLSPMKHQRGQTYTFDKMWIIDRRLLTLEKYDWNILCALHLLKSRCSGESEPSVQHKMSQYSGASAIVNKYASFRRSVSS
ncbi:MAG: hypothetical protein AB7C92_07470, partial [Synergistaceae bacterium]